MKRIILTYTLAFSLLSAYAGEGGSPPLKNTDKSLLIDYVDPFIGTTNFGTTNPGADLPQWYDVCGSFQCDGIFRKHIR